jgi:DNA-binding CsgD family transcriptional regulator
MHLAAHLAPGSSTIPPLVGRERELLLLRATFDAMLAGRGSLILIGGEAGIGKTALVNAIVHEAADEDALILTGHCYDLTVTPPYGPWQDLIDRYHPASGEASLSGFVSALRSLGSEAVVFHQARDFVFDLAAGHPLVLVLEDVHCADQDSLDLLRYLARSISNHRILLIVTYRNDEVTRRHPLFAFLPLLVRESDAQLLELRRLAEADIRTLVRERYGLCEADENRLVDHLQGHADGIRLFLQEMLRSLVADRVLQWCDGTWTLGELKKLPVPSLIHQVIERRLLHVNPATRELLRVAAVIGEEVSLDLWQEVSEVSDDDLIAVSEQIANTHLMEEILGSSTVRFSHSLVRQALYDETPLPRRRRLHRRVANAMIAQPATDPDIVAHHLRYAGDERAAEWLIQAGDRAQRASAWATAAARYEAALRLLEKTGVDSGQQGWLCYRVARLWRYLDPYKSLRYFDEAERLAGVSGDRVLAAFAVFDRGMVQSDLIDRRRALSEMEAGYHALDELEHASTPLDPDTALWVADMLPQRASQRPTRETDTIVSTRVRRGHLIAELSAAGYFSRVIALADPFLAQLACSSDRDDLTMASYALAQEGLAHAYCTMARPEDSQLAHAAAQEIWRTLDYHPTLGTSALVTLAETVLPYRTKELRERRRLESIADQSHRRAGGVWEMDSARACPLFLPVLLLEGHWDEARRLTLATVKQHMGDPHFNSAAALGWLAYRQGDPDLAWEQVATLLPDGPASEPGTSKFLRTVETQRLAVELALVAGNLKRASEWLAAHDRWLNWSGAILGRAEGLLLWGRLFHTEGQADLAREYAQRALELASEPEQPLALIAAHRVLGQLDTDAWQHAEAEEHLIESLKLAEACAAPFERALTLLALAELRAAAGDTVEAQNLCDEVIAICKPLAARPTLERVEALKAKLADRRGKVTLPAGLTQREVEVLRLIAQGKTDREIGQQLFISRHTVMRHVSHILAKLDVESRSAAAVHAVRHGLV